MPINKVVISRAALDAIHRHATEAYPEEAVGLLASDRERTRVTSSQRLVNEHEDRRHHYHVDGLKLLRQEQAIRLKGARTVGYYHSHPDHPAEFSASDELHVQPQMLYLIVSIRQGVPLTSACWVKNGDEDPPTQITLRIDEEQL